MFQAIYSDNTRHAKKKKKNLMWLPRKYLLGNCRKTENIKHQTLKVGVGGRGINVKLKVEKFSTNNLKNLSLKSIDNCQCIRTVSVHADIF